MNFYKRTVKFCSFLYQPRPQGFSPGDEVVWIFDWNPVIHFLVTILVVFSWWLTVIISGFVFSFTLAGSNVYSLFDFLVSKQCKQLFLFCDKLVSSINGLRIVCLSRTAFWLSVFWVRGIQEFRFAYKFNHPLKIDNINYKNDL